MEKHTLTVDGLMKYLGIGRRLAYELVNSDGFPSFRIGKKILVNVDKLQEWIEQSTEKRWQEG